MFVLGLSELGRLAQQTVAADPRFADIIAVQKDDTLYLYHGVKQQDAPEWATRHTEWVKIAPIGGDKYCLAHMALTGNWQELDVEGTVSQCVHAIMENTYHLFFG
jgi:hypothetical protein